MASVYVLSDILGGGNSLGKTSTSKGKAVSDSSGSAAAAFAMMLSGSMNPDTDPKGQNFEADRHLGEAQSSSVSGQGDQKLDRPENTLRYSNLAFQCLIQPMLQSNLPAGKEADSGSDVILENDVSWGTGALAKTDSVNAGLVNVDSELNNAQAVSAGGSPGFAMSSGVPLTTEEALVSTGIASTEVASTGIATPKQKGNNSGTKESDKYKQVIAGLLQALSGEIKDTTSKGDLLGRQAMREVNIQLQPEDLGKIQQITAAVLEEIFNGSLNSNADLRNSNVDFKGQKFSMAEQDAEEKQSKDTVQSDQNPNGLLDALEYGNLAFQCLTQPMLQSNLPAGKEANSGSDVIPGNDVSWGTGALAKADSVNVDSELNNVQAASAGGSSGFVMSGEVPLTTEEGLMSTGMASTGMASPKQHGNNSGTTESDKYKQVIAGLLKALSGEVKDTTSKRESLGLENTGTKDFSQDRVKIVQGWTEAMDDEVKPGQVAVKGEGASENSSEAKPAALLEALTGERKVPFSKAEQTGQVRVNQISPENSKQTGPARVNQIRPENSEQTGPVRVNQIRPGNLEQTGQVRVNQIRPDNSEQTGQVRVNQIKPENSEQIGQVRVNQISPENSEQTGQVRVNQISPKNSEQTGPVGVNQIKPENSEQTGQVRVNQIRPDNSEQTGQVRVNQISPENSEQTGQVRVNQISPKNSEQTGPVGVNQISPENSEQTGQVRVNQIKPDNSEQTGQVRVNQISPENSKQTGPAIVNQIRPENSEQTGPVRVNQIRPGNLEQTGQVRVNQIRPDNSEQTGPVRVNQISPENSEQTSQVRVNQISPENSEQTGQVRVNQIKPDNLEQTGQVRVNQIKPDNSEQTGQVRVNQIKPDNSEQTGQVGVNQIRPGSERRYSGQDEVKPVQSEMTEAKIDAGTLTLKEKVTDDAVKTGQVAVKSEGNPTLNAKLATLLTSLYSIANQEAKNVKTFYEVNGTLQVEGDIVDPIAEAPARILGKQPTERGNDFTSMTQVTKNTVFFTQVEQKSNGVDSPENNLLENVREFSNPKIHQEENAESSGMKVMKDQNYQNSDAILGSVGNSAAVNVADGKTVAIPVWKQIATVFREQVIKKHQALKEMDIQLHPAELGKIQIAMRWENGQIHLQLQASEAATGQLLQNQLSDLRQNLTNQGVSCGMLQMGQGGERQHNPHGDESQRRFNQNTHLNEEGDVISDTNRLFLEQDGINRINVTA